MTAPQSVVTVEHDGNVTFLSWRPVEPPRPPLIGRPAPGMRSGEEAASTRRRARLAACWRRSQLRTDLADAGVVIGLAIAVLICAVIWPDGIAQLAHTVMGGGR